MEKRGVWGHGRAAAGFAASPLGRDEHVVTGCREFARQGLCSAFYNLLMAH